MNQSAFESAEMQLCRSNYSHSEQISMILYNSKDVYPIKSQVMRRLTTQTNICTDLNNNDLLQQGHTQCIISMLIPCLHNSEQQQVITNIKRNSIYTLTSRIISVFTITTISFLLQSLKDKHGHKVSVPLIPNCLQHVKKRWHWIFERAQ